MLTRSRPSVDTRADEGAIAATKLALDKALALFVKRNDLEMAAVSCEELAELHVESGSYRPLWISSKRPRIITAAIAAAGAADSKLVG